MLEKFLPRKERLEQKELPKVDAVVVLGGEFKRDKSGREIPGIHSKMRLIAALELWRRGLADKIIITGGVFQDRQRR